MNRYELEQRIKALEMLRARWVGKLLEASLVDSPEADKEQYRMDCQCMVDAYAG